MPNPLNFAKPQLGGPFGLCFAIVVCLTAGNAIGFRGVGVALAWYVTAAGIGYAGRLPIHVLGCGYVALHPQQEPDSERCRWRYQLNIAVALNLLSILVWAATATWLHCTVDGSMLLRSAACSALFVPVFALALFTVDRASKLGLERGTEWLCSSWFGRTFLWIEKLTPRRSPAGILFGRFKKLTPTEQASAFLVLITSALLAFPAAGLGGRGLGRLLGEEIRGSKTESTESEHQSVGPLYEEQCPDLPSPGVGAPRPQRELLHALWLDGERFGIRSAGAEQAGCAHIAKQVGEQLGVYYALGFCGSKLRSLGVTSTDYLPALLYQPAAGFALHLANEEVLIGASRRHDIRGGDFYLAYTTYGSWALIRSRASSGDDQKADGDLPCERVAENNVAYEHVPPGLLNVWQQMELLEWAWPEQVASQSNGSSEFIFRSEDPTAEPLATASCVSVTYCAAHYKGNIYATEGSLYATVQAIEGLAR